MIIKTIKEIDEFLKENKNPQVLPKDWFVTPNFGWWEFFRNEADTPSFQILQNIACLANRLQVLRDTVFDRPITINSGWRSPNRNKILILQYDQMIANGQKTTYSRPAENSFHLHGMAADIVVAGYEPKLVYSLLKNWQGGLGDGSKMNFTHIDLGNVRKFSY